MLEAPPILKSTDASNSVGLRAGRASVCRTDSHKRADKFLAYRSLGARNLARLPLRLLPVSEGDTDGLTNELASRVFSRSPPLRQASAPYPSPSVSVLTPQRVTVGLLA